MKKLLIALCFMPMFAFAQDVAPVCVQTLDPVAAVTQDVNPEFTNCGGSSDIECFGRYPGSFCQARSGRNHNGICRQSGFPDGRGDVQCYCQ